MRRPRPFVALLLSLLLLGSQQAAFAHLISHIGAAHRLTVVENDGDAGHGAAATLAHVCTTCVAFAAVTGGALPSAQPSLFGVADVAQTPLSSLLPAVAGAAVSPYRARAPPAVL